MKTFHVDGLKIEHYFFKKQKDVDLFYGKIDQLVELLLGLFRKTGGIFPFSGELALVKLDDGSIELGKPLYKETSPDAPDLIVDDAIREYTFFQKEDKSYHFHEDIDETFLAYDGNELIGTISLTFPQSFPINLRGLFNKDFRKAMPFVGKTNLKAMETKKGYPNFVIDERIMFRLFGVSSKYERKGLGLKLLEIANKRIRDLGKKSFGYTSYLLKPTLRFYHKSGAEITLSNLKGYKPTLVRLFYD